MSLPNITRGKILEKRLSISTKEASEAHVVQCILGNVMNPVKPWRILCDWSEILQREMSGQKIEAS